MPGTDPATSSRLAPAPSLRGTVVFVALVAGLFLVGGVMLQILLGEVGLLLSQLLFLAVPAVLFVFLTRLDPVRVFSIRLPTSRQVVGGLVFLAGGVQIAWFLAWAQSFIIPVPVDYLQAMAEVLRPESVGRFLWLILLVAVTPAIAEELFFRGVILAGFRNAVPTFWAIVAVGLIFGLFHLTPHTAFRFLPTAWMGILLAWVVVVSGSLPLAIVLHFANNAAILTLGALPLTQEQVAGAEQSPPLLLFPVAVLLFVVGARMIPRATEASSTPPTSPDTIP
jgi:membrane protease YdiL (CAAX protease family)